MMATARALLLDCLAASATDSTRIDRSAECVIVSRHSTSGPPATSPSGTGSSVGEPAVEHEEPINAVAPEEHVVDEAVIDGASNADDEDEENDECVPLRSVSSLA